MNKTYHLFISHSWAYSDAYEKLIGLLDKDSSFAYTNYSVPKDDPLHPKIRTIVTQNLRFENTKPGQEQAVPFDGLCSPASSAYG